MPAPQEGGWSPNIRSGEENEGLTTLLQYARTAAIQNALRKAEAASPRENAPKVGQIQSLGLIGKDDESRALLQTNAA